MGTPVGPREWDAARRAETDAFVSARRRDDVDGMAAAALRLAALQHFGGPGGRTPALLHEAYLAAADAPAIRVRLAAALARSWVYANDAARGAPFAAEAIELAEAAGDATVLADALDAQLASCWGPDDLTERLRVTARLQDVAAHVDNVRTRMDAHLWRLTTALETLDVTGVHRQLSALDVLAEETGSALVRYFAMTRRAMHAVLVDDLDRARELVEPAYRLGTDIGVVDAYAIYHSQLAEIARHADDVDAVAEAARLFEDYAVSHGIESLLAEAAVLAMEGGDAGRAARLVQQIAGGGFASVPRDVDWMLTVTKVVDAAAGCGLVDVAYDGMTLLAPYAGRAAVNAGAVVCVGVVEDFLWRAAALTGDARADGWRAAASAAYARLDATWLRRRLDRGADDRSSVVVPRQRELAPASTHVMFRPVDGQRFWSIGTVGRECLVPDMKGLHYLHTLLQRPGIDVSALVLMSRVAGHHVVVEERDTGEPLDRRALAAYRQRLRDIDEELEEAQSWADPARAERLEAERAALLREVAAGTGLHGRPRAAGSSAERARVAVRKAIAAALDRIESADPPTARRLRASVRTGGVCRYDPDPDAGLDWQL